MAGGVLDPIIRDAERKAAERRDAERKAAERRDAEREAAEDLSSESLFKTYLDAYLEKLRQSDRATGAGATHKCDPEDGKRSPKLLLDRESNAPPPRELLFSRNCDYLNEYLKLIRLKSQPEAPSTPPCPNPLCDHKTPEEDPEPVKVPMFDCIDTIEQVLAIAETFHCRRNALFKGIHMERMFGLIEPLRELQSMVGLTKNKSKIVEQVLYFLKNYQDVKNRDMMHTVITGPSGTGKTTFARIIGRIYSKLGLVSKGHFVEVTREDLIGKYLGHTAHQTGKIIDKCKGGIMFIDEVYSLGHSEKRDSFSKECIDILNQRLSENRDMLCIIAGYEEDIEKCFFSQNRGLKRRFPFVYNLEGYNGEEMMRIFKQKIQRDNWEVDDAVLDKFRNRFDKNTFKYYGGDIETFVFKAKIAYAQTHFYTEGRKIDKETLEKAFKLFEAERKDANEGHMNMYI